MNQSHLHTLLHYDPETGDFTWLKKPAPNSSVKPGEKAGSLHKLGYIRIYIQGFGYFAHRLAVLYMTGAWPEHEVDHINFDRADNRWSNLRVCDIRDNRRHGRKRYMKRDRKYKGAYPENGRWKSVITHNGKTKHLGMYKTEEEAARRYDEEAIKLFGEFAHLNFS